MMLVDSHCHFDLLDKALPGNEPQAVIERAKKNGVSYFLNVCVAISDFDKVLAICDQYDCISASVGLHPNEQAESIDIKTLLQLGAHPKVIAIGETGLDYFRSTGETDWQRDRFRLHIEAAKQLQKPLIIHMRDATVDTLSILKSSQASNVGGVFHCFSEDWETAQKALDLGFYISFSGVVTFKNAKAIQDVAIKLPLDRMLLETDSPYLAPMPYRGKPNEPGYVRYTAEYIAMLRGVTLDEVSSATTSNFFNLFKGATKPHV